MAEKNTYLKFLGFLGFLGFENPWYFLFFLFFLFFFPTVKDSPKSLIQKQTEEKEKHKWEIAELLKTQGRITNNEAERLFGVSDRTAQRYFSELKKEGKIKQHKQTGRGVFYTKA